MAVGSLDRTTGIAGSAIKQTTDTTSNCAADWPADDRAANFAHGAQNGAGVGRAVILRAVVAAGGGVVVGVIQIAHVVERLAGVVGCTLGQLRGVGAGVDGLPGILVSHILRPIEGVVVLLDLALVIETRIGIGARRRVLIHGVHAACIVLVVLRLSLVIEARIGIGAAGGILVHGVHAARVEL